MGWGLVAGKVGTDVEVETDWQAWTCGGLCRLPWPQGHPGLWVPQPQILALVGSTSLMRRDRSGGLRTGRRIVSLSHSGKQRLHSPHIK